MPKLSIHLFGLPQIHIDGAPIKVERRKTLALISYLAVQGSSSREVLSGLLWPDCSQEQAAGYLRQALWDFHKVAGEGWIERDGPALRLRSDADLSVDINEFKDRLSRWKAASRGSLAESDAQAVTRLLEEAAGLYTADFLAGLTLRDCPEFETWQTLEAEGLRLKLAEALEALARRYANQNAYEEALASARRWLALDELNEPAHRELMRLYDESGQRSAALRQYETCQHLLEEALGVAPENATTQLFQQISARRLSTSRGAAGRTQETAPGQPRPAMSAPIPLYLPPQPGAFLGRENELAQIKEMLANPECRLVTLVGPGGTGKTRLAVQAASQSIGYPYGMSFPHGVYFAGLAPANSPGEIIQAVAAALKFDFRTGRGDILPPDIARTQLLQFLSSRKLLLVVDNLEHLAEHAFLFSEILASAPGVKLIATSRIRLGLAEEWVLEVSGLPVPEESSGEGIERFAAVQLFIRGAERTGKFSPSPEDWAAVARICRMLDGLPLGIEMAAAWVKMLSCQEIAGEIAASLDFLESSRPGTPERQRSMRGVFEHSWRLLSENERAVLSRLSVFTGGFTRDAAFQVAGASLAVLGALADKSLLRRISSGRFDLHELVKQYAAEKLADGQDAAQPAQEETQMRHAAYYAGFLRLKGAQLRGSEQASGLAALRADFQNVRKAWEWLVQSLQIDLLHLVLPDLLLFFEVSGDHGTGRDLMRMLTDRLKSQDAQAVRAETLDGVLSLGLAGLRRFGFAFDPAETGFGLLAESQELAARLPKTRIKAFISILNGNGPSPLSPGQVVAMEEEAFDIFQQSSDWWGCGLANVIIADTLAFTQTDIPGARKHYETALGFFERVGNDFGRALCLYGLCRVNQMLGDIQEAYRCSAAALEIYQGMANTSRIFESRDALAEFAKALGNKEQARELWSANLAILINAGEKRLRKVIEERLAEL